MYIKEIRTGGVDWHDIHTIFKQLAYKENYNIDEENVEETIANRIVEIFPYIVKQDLLEAMKNKSKITGDIKEVFEQNGKISYIESSYYFENGKKDYEDSWKFDGKDLKFYEDYYFGQISYTTTFKIKDIKDQNKVYIVTEDFLCPTKGVDVVERLYHDVFTDEEEALEYFNNLEIHTKEDYNAEKVFLIASKNDICNCKWYENQIEAMELMKQKNQTHLDDSFSIFTDNHISTLQLL